MVRISLSFNTKSGKNLEFMQSIGSIIVNLRKVKGCLGIDFQQDSQEKNRFSFQMDWENQTSIKALFDSGEYSVFEGAMRILCKELNIAITDGNKTIKAAPQKNGNINIKKQILQHLKHNF